MQIKKYEAVDMPSAIQMIKRDLGPEAVILSSRQLRKGRGHFGLFGRPMVEVTAAADREEPAGRPVRRRERRAAVPWQAPEEDRVTSAEASPWIGPIREELQEIRSGMEQLQRGQGSPQELQVLIEEFQSVRHLLESSLREGQTSLATYPPCLRHMGQRLLVSDVDERIVHKLLSGMQSRLPESCYATEQTAEISMRRVIENALQVQGGLELDRKGARKLALIGPTGVGKTTTLAKIAAEYALSKKHKVALVTIDTYRIAAIEQLKIYANIIGIPVEVVVHPEDLARACGRHDDKELILIDTAGRSHRNAAQIRELETVLGGARDLEKHLVLSTTTGPEDLAGILRNFKSVGYDYLLFTKVDEGSRFGTILSAVLQTGRAVSYLTNGQRVPEDIQEANVRDLAALILAPRGVPPSPVHPRSGAGTA